ncbi:MAG TPA: DUF4389 domain-containing protein [Solirubrobacteraceae bacterium]|jgi:hypothetical protein|nr:DUF4389 domain-containing protein [Solirubrobacteraceae bacterium]
MSTPEGTPPPPPSAPQPGAAGPVASAVAVPNPSGPPSPPYPVQLEISYPEELNRWLPFVKGILAFPHWIALFFVGIGAFVMLIYAWFAVLFTGRYPRSAFDFITGVLRWAARVGAYVYFMTDAYPPFSLEDDPNYPVRLAIEYPEGIARWRPLIQGLLAFPALIGAWVLAIVANFAAFIAWFAIVFTKRYPRGLFEIVTAHLRWNARVTAYYYFMTEQYPPFVYG